MRYQAALRPDTTIIPCRSSVRSSAQIDQVTKALGLGSQRQLTDSKVSAGLKEALRVGAENSVKLLLETEVEPLTVWEVPK